MQVQKGGFGPHHIGTLMIVKVHTEWSSTHVRLTDIEFSTLCIARVRWMRLQLHKLDIADESLHHFGGRFPLRSY